MTITAARPEVENDSLGTITEAARLSARTLASLNVGDQFVLHPVPGADVLTVATAHMHAATPQPFATIEATDGQRFNSDSDHLGHPVLREQIAPYVYLLRPAA